MDLCHMFSSRVWLNCSFVAPRPRPRPRLGVRDANDTVKYHLAAVLEKLGVRSRTEAVSLGVRTGLAPL